MRSKTKWKAKCLKCGAGPFKTAQALGAHNRYAHPKVKHVSAKEIEAGFKDAAAEVDTPEESTAKERVRQKIEAGFKAADVNLNLDRVNEENWYLRFLLRRGAKLDPTLDLMAAVRLEIVKLEQELDAPFS